ncbi:hypothetical protein F5X99DRAFT_401202 [Biscogniauxia marginata]|nr:hypothetical protein F5X99DRAFT_401202 [Biscogniauxia marginata]
MAIVEDVPGVEVTILVRGQPSREYEDGDSSEAQDQAGAACPVACKYIECADDTEFVVQTKITGYKWGYRNHALSSETYVDGKRIRGVLIRSLKCEQYCPYTCTVQGEEKYDRATGRWSVHRFKFAAVDTVDEARKERVAEDIKIAKNLGVIEVKLLRVTEHGPTGYSQRASGINPGTGKFELTEKSLKGKAISHGTSYSKAESISAPRFVDTRTIPEDNGPIAIYRFLYRSREALKRELIIPRSPAPSPTLQGLTDAERDRLARERLEELKQAKIKKERNVIKREFGEVFDLTKDNDEVPLEPPRPTKVSRLSSGREVEVVDLTDD